MKPGDFMKRIVESLVSAEVPHMLTGSFASAFHGKPRATQDLDIVISPTREGLAKLLKTFSPEHFYVDPEAAQEALDRKGQFNVIDPKSGWKADFIILKGRPFSQKEFERRTQADVLGVSVHIVTPEDLILAKLEWAAESESQRQIEDAAGILRAKSEKLDGKYLQHWVRELSLEPEWEKACKIAGTNPIVKS
jgi:hypothetical protein